MASQRDLLSALQEFIEAPKRILGADHGYVWGPGYSKHERKAKFPLEINGESEEAARFEVIGFPDSNTLKFRLVLCFNAAVCRLDYTDETHSNSRRIDTDNVPYSVTGPHYHSWPLNRRFFMGQPKAPELHNAEHFEMRGSFDSILRWFCDDVNISPLLGSHLITLPTRETLL